MAGNGGTSTVTCPRCGSPRTVPIAYGYPDDELWEAEERGEVAVGGCVIGREGGDFDRACLDCEHPWVSGVIDPKWALE